MITMTTENNNNGITMEDLSEDLQGVMHHFVNLSDEERAVFVELIMSQVDEARRTQPEQPQQEEKETVSEKVEKVSENVSRNASITLETGGEFVDGVGDILQEFVRGVAEATCMGIKSSTTAISKTAKLSGKTLQTRRERKIAEKKRIAAEREANRLYIDGEPVYELGETVSLF